MIKVLVNTGQTLSHPDWWGYSTDHKGELDLEDDNSELVATFAPNVWRYVYEADTTPVIDNPAPPQPYQPF